MATRLQQQIEQKKMDEELKINLGAGHERFRGWKSLDIDPRNPSRRVDTTQAKGGELRADEVPDIISVLPKIPVPTESVSMLRSKDLLMDYESAGFSIPRLGREIRRVLKKGGRVITIEVAGFERALKPYLRIVSVRPGSVAPYIKDMIREGGYKTDAELEEAEGVGFGGRYFVTMYIKD